MNSRQVSEPREVNNDAICVRIWSPRVVGVYGFVLGYPVH
jgi:hypothetical protein